MLDKLVLRYLGGTSLRNNSLHWKQHAYISERSWDFALRHLLRRIKKVLQRSYKEVTLGAFLDIQGAFDNTDTAVVNNAKAHEFHAKNCRQTEALLRNRKFTPLFHDEVIEVNFPCCGIWWSISSAASTKEEFSLRAILMTLNFLLLVSIITRLLAS